jgi:hypothetical protein
VSPLAIGTAKNVGRNEAVSVTDDDGDFVSLSIAEAATNGTCNLMTNETQWLLCYVPNTNFWGSDHVKASFTDGWVTNFADVTITVTQTNTRPVAAAQNVTSLAGMTTDITLTGTDADGDTLTFAITSLPGHGTLTGTSSNRVYTSERNYFGPDSFEFTVSDGWEESDAAEVSLHVLPVNRAPLLTGVRVNGTNMVLEALAQPGRVVTPAEAMDVFLPNGWTVLTNLAQAIPQSTNEFVPVTFHLDSRTNRAVFYRLKSGTQ